VGLDHEYKYTGKLYAANEAQPAKMNVRFPLNPIGAASFVVLDTDYTSYGLICTCQEIDLFITTGHRRSCSMLQRAVEEDEAVGLLWSTIIIIAIIIVVIIVIKVIIINTIIIIIIIMSINHHNHYNEYNHHNHYNEYNHHNHYNEY